MTTGPAIHLTLLFGKREIMADVEYDVSDLELGANDAIRAILKGAKLGITKGAMAISKDAKLLAPVDTGRLRGSITYVVNASDDEVSAAIGTSVEYAAYNEFGTGRSGAGTNVQFGPEDTPVEHDTSRKGHIAQPYIRPAFYGNQEKVKELVSDSINEMLSKLSK